MRRSLGTALVVTSLTLAMAAAGIGLGACGGSPDAGEQAQAGPSGMPQPNGQTADPSAMFRTQLDALVKTGMITGAQKTAIAGALSSVMGAASPGAQRSTGGSSTQTY